MKARKIVLVVCIMALLTGAMTFTPSSAQQPGAAQSQVEPTAAAEAIPVDQIIVKYKASANLIEAEAAQAAAQMQRLSEAAGVALAYFRPMSGEAHVLRLPERTPVDQALEITAKLAALPEVEFAEPDYVMQAIGNPAEGILATPNDPQYTNQWHYFAPGGDHYGVNAPAAWDITTGSPSIRAAVIDTGILNHADLSGRWVGGYDFISNVAMANDGDGRDASPLDPGDWIAANECGYTHNARNSSWHGTHVAGTIGAASNNGAGVAGLNWVSQVVPARVLGKCGGLSSDIADAMRWTAGLAVTGVPANAYPAKVINMSLGGQAACSVTYQDAVNAVIAAGSVLVVSAGNNDMDASLFTPGNCNGVITIAATNRNGGRAYYSNYGTSVEIAAPGGAQSAANDPNGVLSTLNTGTTTPGSDAYIYYQGTSMAAPHVTGVVSLMFSVNASLTPAQVLSILQSTVTAFPTGTGADCTTSTCGSGIVNAPAAVTAAQNPGTTYKVFLPMANKNYPPQAAAWTTILSEGFEGAFPGAWTVLDNYSNGEEHFWGKRNCRAFAGSYGGWAIGAGANGSGLGCGANYPNYADSWMIYGPFNLTGATAADLKFKLWLYSESDYDKLCYMASTNGTNFYGTCVTGNSSGWIDRTLDLSNVYTLGSLLGQSQVWIALEFSSDVSDNFAEGAHVDEIVLRKCVGGTCPALNAGEITSDTIRETNVTRQPSR